MAVISARVIDPGLQAHHAPPASRMVDQRVNQFQRFGSFLAKTLQAISPKETNKLVHLRRQRTPGNKTRFLENIKIIREQASQRTLKSPSNLNVFLRIFAFTYILSAKNNSLAQKN